MLTIPNLPTQDRYVDALTLGPVPAARMLKYVVANKSVFARVWPQSKSGTIPAQTDELLITPETNIITDAMGIQFRSAVPGVPAQVIAQLLEPGDPTLGSGTPFSSTISSTGGISPGVSSVQIQHNGALVATEPTLDFVDANANQFAVSDDPANTRVTVALPRTLTGIVSAGGGILAGAGFTVTRTGVGLYTVTFTTPFAASGPAVAVAQFGHSNPFFYIIVAVNTIGLNNFTVETFSPQAGGFQDCAFSFIAQQMG